MNDEGASVQLPPHQQLVRSDQWPLVGERQAAAGPAEWSLALAGEVVRPRRWSLAEFAALPQTAVVVDIHCVTRWSKLGVEFRGVLLRDVLAQVEATDRARFVSFIARSDRGHSTSLPLADALELGTLLATHVDGELLPAEHGGPLRSVVPHRYFYKSLKWLERIELLAENRLGYWEAEAGYHDRADPWREERYMAADIDRRWARRLIESRNFSGQALRSIDCALCVALRAQGGGRRNCVTPIFPRPSWSGRTSAAPIFPTPGFARRGWSMPRWPEPIWRGPSWRGPTCAVPTSAAHRYSARRSSTDQPPRVSMRGRRSPRLRSLSSPILNGNSSSGRWPRPKRRAGRRPEPSAAWHSFQAAVRRRPD